MHDIKLEANEYNMEMTFNNEYCCLHKVWTHRDVQFLLESGLNFQHKRTN